jgi:hypothetical protein
MPRLVLPIPGISVPMFAILTCTRRSRFRTVAVVNHHLEPAHFRVVHDAAKAGIRSALARIVVARRG